VRRGEQNEITPPSGENPGGCGRGVPTSVSFSRVLNRRLGEFPVESPHREQIVTRSKSILQCKTIFGSTRIYILVAPRLLKIRCLTLSVFVRTLADVLRSISNAMILSLPRYLYYQGLLACNQRPPSKLQYPDFETFMMTCRMQAMLWVRCWLLQRMRQSFLIHYLVHHPPIHRASCALNIHCLDRNAPIYRPHIGRIGNCFRIILKHAVGGYLDALDVAVLRQPCPADTHYALFTS
jgi:hypothetical protein